ECMEDKDGDDWGDDDPAGPATTAGTDCDDDTANAADTFPGAAANDSATECMEDKDGDDWGDDDPSDPGTTAGTDCDDDTGAGANTFPGAAPNDSATACMEDKDGDDWGDADPSDPDADAGSDCDDDSASAADTFPGSAENEDPADACMKDSDGDGWGDDSPPAGVTDGSDCDEDGEPPCALVVTQDGTGDDSYDQGLATVLLGQSFEITYVADTAADLEDANGFTVIVISETALSSDIGGTFEDALVPAVVLEGFIWDDMSMAPAGVATTDGDVDILAVGDARAGGLAATHSVINGGGSGLFFTAAPAGADSIASVSGSADDIVYFTFDQGDTMLGGFSAPRRRVGLGYDADQSAGAVSILPDGQTLFDAALTWVIQ
ncbi:MAG: hypothetical protein KUG77_19295, partial [Nannocystaceae bacterium]|nr:hypothetical protein [Nannocystaceae bacterium]